MEYFGGNLTWLYYYGFGFPDLEHYIHACSIISELKCLIMKKLEMLVA